LQVGAARVMNSRGCPFNCSYCSNHALKKPYPNKEKYVRYRGVDKAIEYLKSVINEDKRINNIIFMDNILFLNKSWFDEFIDKYIQEINLPFICRGHVSLLTEDVAKKLKKAKCSRVLFGVESGNEYMRNEILQRRMSNKEIRDAFSICRAHKLKTESYNMVGLPYENNKMILDTIKLNAQIRPNYPRVFVFYPYPSTELFKVCKKERFITDKRFDNYLEGTILNQPTISQDEVMFAFNYFGSLVKLYLFIYKSKLLKPAEKILDKIFYSEYLPRRVLINLNTMIEDGINNILAFIREFSPRFFNLLKKIYLGELNLKFSRHKR
jgi:radical SAM superfamily enzyme YgiQ (UPF0313 family)